LCSGSPDMVKKCGSNGAIKPSYKTTFTNAEVNPDYIDGTRVTQGVRNCSLDSSEDGTAPFSLRRLVPCEFEEVMVKQRDNELLDIVLKTFIPAFAAFVTAADAAQRRFGGTYRDMPTSALRFPQDRLRVATNDPEGTEALAAALPEIVTTQEWTAARVMADDMGWLAEPPLMEARQMIEQIIAVEQKALDARRAFSALEGARAALRKCRQAQP